MTLIRDTSEIHSKVYASKAWQKTGIEMQSGDTVKISASGEIQYTSRSTAPSKGKSSPIGVPLNSPPVNGDSNDFRKYVINSQWNHCALIAKVGDQIVLVGKGTQFTALQQGELVMRINDTDLKNNSGFFDVSISRGFE